jgi:TPR repeat protein
LGRNLGEFFGLGGGDTTHLWPRWLVLRAVGIVYLFVFAGIIAEGRVLVGPQGIAPVAPYFAEIEQALHGGFAAIFRAPSLLWLNASNAMIGGLAWLGFAAAVALVLNLWPRLALLVCWMIFLSFVTVWGEFSPAQLDRLMVEVAVLCIPFAPPGVRPGLGANAPPRPIAVFMMRWLLFRVMFGSGVVKLISSDSHWRDLTAMDVMYETSPSPTVLGYWAHQLPHAYHLLEIAFTFTAELVGPVLAVFGGRRGRWFALIAWTALQAGIQLTCNFGWLNVAAFGLGLLLLDDRMLVAAVDRLGLKRLGMFLSTKAVQLPAVAITAWRLHGLRAVLGLHFLLGVFYFAQAFGMPDRTLPVGLEAVVKFFAEFRSANLYKLYSNFDDAHYQVDFEGSADGGKTWRTYDYRTIPQAVDRRPPFRSPWFDRFDITMQILSARPPVKTVLPLVAAHLLAGDPAVLDLFERNPFPEGPPRVVRMRRYRLAFTDAATLGKTRQYWTKEYAGDYWPALYITERGGIGELGLGEADAALSAGSYGAAFSLYDRQFRLGNVEAGYRLADMYARGLGMLAQPAKAFALYADLAGRGEVQAIYGLGFCYEQGIGVPADLGKASELYHRAADQGNIPALYAFGLLAANDRLAPRADVEGLLALWQAMDRAKGDDETSVAVRRDAPAQIKRLISRMSPADVAAARGRSGARH